MAAINGALLEHHVKRAGCTEIFEDFGNGTVRQKDGHVAALDGQKLGHVVALGATPRTRTAGEVTDGEASGESDERLRNSIVRQEGKIGDLNREESAAIVAGKADGIKKPADEMGASERSVSADEDAAAGRAQGLGSPQPLDDVPSGVLWAAIVYVILVAFWLATTRRMARSRPRISLETFRGLESGNARDGKMQLGKA